MMSLALWLLTGCVSESMKSVSDRVFQRAAEQFLLMDSNLAEGEFPRSLDTLGNLVTSDSKWWCCGFFPGSLWYTYEYTGDERIKALAEKYKVLEESFSSPGGTKALTDDELFERLEASSGELSKQYPSFSLEKSRG